ncbi:hydrogenase maturation nickel metallochaperone HypA [Oculatella sp. LEGE 06141]|uniref:hydrogenase maturation nickel metallochaperone HypA n=1 Tax=Oculatella sp. LEGE 06141 TaxID=1828648 RepID=UPI0018807303|nr:hydrogenase maturation nickel metallochaperone HypA [Oculatella sp. LEGE 06141]MBE9181751.1 hydrogenase maturation nickel metallochaperone HypA [Oculatella sp. LEGE 06141]
MHEVGMIQSILDTAVARAKEEGAQHIRFVQMRVGEASGVVPESLERAFAAAKQGTIAEEAHLQIDYVPTVCYCSRCDLEFQPAAQRYECPQCRQIITEIRQGKEFELAFLECLLTIDEPTNHDKV